MRAAMTFFAVGFVLYTYGAPAEDASELEMTVQAQKPTLYVGEPVVLLVKLRNNTDRKVSIMPIGPSHFLDNNIVEVFYKAVNSQEYKRFRLRSFTHTWFGWSSMLKPGEEFHFVIDVLSYCLQSHLVFKEAGTYDIKLRFSEDLVGQRAPGEPPILRVETTTPVKVVPPPPDANEAAKLWLRLLAQREQGGVKSSEKELRQELRSSHSDTIYAQYLLYVAIRRIVHQHEKTSPRVKEHIDFLLDKHHFPLREVVAFEKLRQCPEPGSPEQRVRQLERYLEEYPDSIYALRVKKALEIHREYGYGIQRILWNQWIVDYEEALKAARAAEKESKKKQADKQREGK